MQYNINNNPSDRQSYQANPRSETNVEYAQLLGNAQEHYNNAQGMISDENKETVKKYATDIKKNEYVKDAQKFVCSPALKQFEKHVLQMPISSKDKLMFNWCFESKDYDTESFEPYKANGMSRTEFIYAISQIWNVENFDVETIKPNAIVVWGVTIGIFLAFLGCIFVLIITDSLVWTILLCCIIGFLAFYSMYSNIKQEQTWTLAKVDKRRLDINES